MTDEVFTASNGIIVTINSQGYLVAKGGRDGMTTYATAGAHYGVQALREYFQHERDQELGRWRDPENPDMVCYPGTELEGIQDPNIWVVDEATGKSLQAWKKLLPLRYGQLAIRVSETAQRYFDAYPETKPWHGAKPGEVWLLTVGEQELALVLDNRPDNEFSNAEGLKLPVTNPAITHAEKIYPKDEEKDDE